MYLHFIDVKINLYKNKLSYTFQLFSLFPLIILEIPIASHPTLYMYEYIYENNVKQQKLI